MKMEISSVTLIDGTVFKLDEYRFGGTIKRIYMMYYPNENLDSGWEVYVDITKREKPLHIPYHSVLFYLEK